VLLNFAQNKGIRNVQAFGDSKLVLDWFKGREQLVILASLSLQHKIRQLQEAFDFVTIEHFYWDFNHKIDALSKEDVSLHEGMLMKSQELQHPLK
jgi:hypothetical protein